jgi:outer membrane protein OmpA-like peptidoglycan-associated protein
MKKRIFIVVAVSTALTIPVWAQQGNATSQTGSQATSDREPLQAPKSTDFWDGDDPNVANLIAHPFATKKYVQRHTQPIKDRLNELDELTTENGRNIKDVDSRAQQGLQLASAKVSVADQHAGDATNKAQLAQTAARDASTRVASAEQAIGNLDQYKGTAQTEIRFRAGQTGLSKTAKKALDSMAAPLQDQRSYIIEVRGFAPGHGRAAVANSRQMADSVVRYLVLTHHIPVYRIYTMSLGNASAEGQTTSHVSSRRVEVSVLQNPAVATAQK